MKNSDIMSMGAGTQVQPVTQPTRMDTGPEPEGEPEALVAVWESEASSARMDVICRMLGDPQYQAHEVLRLITLEMACALSKLFSMWFVAPRQYFRNIAATIHTLRVLSKQVKDDEEFRIKADTLNFDGTKFKFAVNQMVGLFRVAMTEAKLTEFQRDCVMRIYRDLMSMNDARIRKETEKVGSVDNL